MRLLAYTLLFSVLFSLLARLQVCASYMLNQRYYAEVLCENKAVKNSCCKGKCAMQKELNNLAAKEEGQPRSQLPILKLNKAEEALVSHYQFNIYNNALLLPAVFKPASKPLKGSLPVRIKPPCQLV